MLANFERFVKERQYLQNVSPATVEWYRESFKWLASERPTAEELKGAVLAMRTKGRNAAGCNSTIRAINAYLKWAGSSQRIAYLKEPQFVLPVFRPEQISKLVRWKADGFYKRRLHLTVLILFDTGARIDEVLSLHVSDRDLDSLLFTLTGKGRKQRRVPFSFELRRVLARYITEYCPHEGELLLATRRGRKLGRRVVLRDVKSLCRQLGFDPPARTLHACRLTFAVNYLRRGGSVFHLQKVLGHSSLEMTRHYANLMTEDLSAIHQKISLLAA